MKNEMEEAIWTDLERSFCLRGDSVTPVSGGWMNRKWKLVCGEKAWLVKQFSRKRFSQKQLDWIEESMQRQIIAQGEGVPCPVRFPFRTRFCARCRTAPLTWSWNSGRV